MSWLMADVSAFKNYISVVPYDVNLLEHLKNDEHYERQQKIAEIDDKEIRDQLKSEMMAILPSCMKCDTRGEGATYEHTRLIQIDIDGDKNNHITNWTLLRDDLKNCSNIAYAGLSVSARGVWGLIPIVYPEKHLEHFIFIEAFFKSKGIIIDPKCKNIQRLRGYAFDPNGYFNHEAKPLKAYYTEKQKPVRPKHYNTSNYNNQSSTAEQVEYLINEITGKGIDITAGYDAWLNIGFALASEFGEVGRQYFHDVSSCNGQYNFKDADKQFTNCLKSRGNGITIASFFHACKMAGIELPKRNVIQQVVNPSIQPLYATKTMSGASIIIDKVIATPCETVLPADYGSYRMLYVRTANGDYDILYGPDGKPQLERNDFVKKVEQFFTKQFQPALIENIKCLAHVVN